jgi:ArsR family transcriptional regulator
MTTHPSQTVEPDHLTCVEPDPAPATVEPPDDDTLAAMAKAVSHPARIAIVRLLTHRDTCMFGNIADQLPLAKSTTSEHLRILREAGLIQGEIDGPRTSYCINQTGLATLRAGIESL